MCETDYSVSVCRVSEGGGGMVCVFNVQCHTKQNMKLISLKHLQQQSWYTTLSQFAVFIMCIMYIVCISEKE